MKLKLDENLGERGADLFRAAGHDVATVANQHMGWAYELEIDSPWDGGPPLGELAYSLLGEPRFASEVRVFINYMLGRDAGKIPCTLLREIIGNPFRNRQISDQWLLQSGRTAAAIARAIYDEERFTDLPILADALEEAGFEQRDLIQHCRTNGTAPEGFGGGTRHLRGCWALDALLGNGIISNK